MYLTREWSLTGFVDRDRTKAQEAAHTLTVKIAPQGWLQSETLELQQNAVEEEIQAEDPHTTTC